MALQIKNEWKLKFVGKKDIMTYMTTPQKEGDENDSVVGYSAASNYKDESINIRFLCFYK